jgi:hypothetical protein
MANGVLPSARWCSMNKREFFTALILRAPIEPAAVSLPARKKEWNPADGVPRRPNDQSYMRGWCAVGHATRRKR